ncbi:sporulation protein [Ferrimonas kyonanensis]|uniref:sporulation protein n=1 Tax=Ferrimonas kyonanensis TaxID=364763 RepID=UPI0004102883|nr:sporulation protein [Ferrimonas kyonanensis]
MSLFNRLLSAIGMGSCEVDTLLQKAQYFPGETVSARVRIKAGNVGQRIHGVYFSLHCSYEQVEEGQAQTLEVELAHFQLADAYKVAAGEEWELPIEFVLPEFTPLTQGKTKVWLATGLDIRQAVDPKDRDYLQVVPQPLAAELLHKVEQLGFEQTLVHTEAVSSMARVSAPYLQMLHYRPISGEFSGRIEEMELALVPASDGVYLHAEVTRTGRGMAAAVSRILAESGDRERLLLTPELVANLPRHLNQLLLD